MKRFIPILVLALLAALVLCAPAGASFGFKDVDVTFAGADGSTSMQAGSHPFAMTSRLDFNTTIDSGSGEEVLDGSPRDLIAELPPGFAADPGAVPACSTADFLLVDGDHPTSNCSDSSAVGVLWVRAPGETGEDPTPVFNLVPSSGSVAKLGFIVATVPVTLDVGVNPNPPYNVVASFADISEAVAVAGSQLTLWGNPADPSHDSERGSCAVKDGSCPVGILNRPFITLPRSCSGPLATIFKIDSWEDPGAWVQAQAATHDNANPPNPLGMTGCLKLDFDPHGSALPTTGQAASPSGFDVDIDISDEGLSNPGGIAQSDIKGIALTLPEGMTINPSVAAGLATCSQAQYAAETVDSEPGEGCPQASKVGAVEIETPLLEGDALSGHLFVASQDASGAQSRSGSTFGLYLVVKDPGLGILVKLPGKVEPDSATGQLVASFGESPDRIPQLPISHLRFHIGESGLLVTPPDCGPYITTMLFTPWANPANSLITTSSFQITSGAGGGPCTPDPTPSPPTVVCAGDACQSPTVAPPSPTPSPGVGAAKSKRGCPKGKRKVRLAGKVRCMPNHKRPKGKATMHRQVSGDRSR